MEITTREYRKQDFDTLESIIRRTWHYDDFSSPATAKKLARVFLSSCLTNYTFSRVALYNGVPAGIILADHKAAHCCSLHSRIRQMTAIASLLLSKEGRTVSRVFAQVSAIDKELLDGCGRTYPAELSLFAVEPDLRGKGIGKFLFQSVLDYMKEQNLDSFYLFTDTSCNYGFYEHQGMRRKMEQPHVFNLSGQKVSMNFFLYDCEC